MKALIPLKEILNSLPLATIKKMANEQREIRWRQTT